jgi:putative pre-16S rRNA nuclease
MPAMLNLVSDRHLLGFDFGTKYIGVAVGQLITKTATPLTTVSNTAGNPDWDKVSQLTQQWDAQALVVGIPLNMNGTAQMLTELAQDFVQALQNRFPIPVYTVDERLTTASAKSELFEHGGYKALSKTNIDQNSARIILEQWLKNYEL